MRTCSKHNTFPCYVLTHYIVILENKPYNRSILSKTNACVGQMHNLVGQMHVSDKCIILSDKWMCRTNAYSSRTNACVGQMHNLVGQMHVSDKCILKSDKCILELSDKCRYLLSDKCMRPNFDVRSLESNLQGKRFVVCLFRGLLLKAGTGRDSGGTSR